MKIRSAIVICLILLLIGAAKSAYSIYCGVMSPFEDLVQDAHFIPAGEIRHIEQQTFRMEVKEVLWGSIPEKTIIIKQTSGWEGGLYTGATGTWVLLLSRKLGKNVYELPNGCGEFALSIPQQAYARKIDALRSSVRRIKFVTAPYDEKTMSSLLTEVGSVNVTGPRMITALMHAAKTNSVPKLRWLISNKADLDQQDNTGKTALMLAAREGHGESVRTLVDAGAKLDLQDADGNTAIMLASLASPALGDFLESRGANPRTRNKNGLNAATAALMYYTKRRDTENIFRAIAKGADVNARDTEGDTALCSAIESGCETKVIGVLLKKGAKTSLPCHGYLPLERALMSNNDVAARELYRGGARIDFRAGGYHHLVRALSEGKIEQVELLLSMGAPVNPAKLSHDDMPPLYYAVTKGNPDLCELLIKRKARTDVMITLYERRRSYLHLAVEDGNLAVIRILLRSRKLMETRDSDGKTPLYHAIDGRNYEVAELLLENGARINNAGTSKDRPLLEIVCAQKGKGWTEIAKQLIKKGADPARDLPYSKACLKEIEKGGP